MCFFVGNLFLREAWGQSKQDPNKGRKSKLSCWAPEILITNNHSCLLGRSLPKNHLQQLICHCCSVAQVIMKILALFPTILSIKAKKRNSQCRLLELLYNLLNCSNSGLNCEGLCGEIDY